LLRERLKSLIHAGRNGVDSTAGEAVRGRYGAAQKAAIPRHSNGLEQFFFAIRDTAGLNILDLSGASQENINFITNLGHRIYTENFLHIVDSTYQAEDSLSERALQDLGNRVLQQCFDFPDHYFDGALVWDSLQHLKPPVLQIAVGGLFRVLRPNAYLFALFSAQERVQEMEACSYRIADSQTLLLASTGSRPVQFFSTRMLEKIFQQYQTVKFFLTRDHLREVLVKR